MPREPTAADVARLAGCSESSVRNWSSRRHLLSPGTAARIAEAVESLGYVPRPGRPRRTGGFKVAFEVPRAWDAVPSPIFDAELRQMAIALWERGHLLLPFSVAAEADAGLDSYERMLTYAPDAVLVPDPLLQGDPRLQLLTTRDIPVATIGRVEEPVCSWVDNDLVAGLEQTVAHLAGRGHHHIAFLGFPHGENVADQEYSGYTRGLLLNGRLPELHRQLTYQAPRDEVDQVLRDLLGDATEPAALIAACDDWALAAIDLAAAGEAPHLRAAVGIDDTPAATARRPYLTSLRQPTAALCRDAVMLLEERVDRPELEPRHLMEHLVLQVRDSTDPGL